jgi:hypothetical protein
MNAKGIYPAVERKTIFKKKKKRKKEGEGK